VTDVWRIVPEEITIKTNSPFGLLPSKERGKTVSGILHMVVGSLTGNL